MNFSWLTINEQSLQPLDRRQDQLMTLLKCKVIFNEHEMHRLVNYPVNPWPEKSQLLPLYDEELVFKHFKIGELGSAQNFFYRQFVRQLCINFNQERAQKVMRPLDLSPQFVSTEQKGLICFFVLPFEQEVRKAALAFLFDSIYVDNSANYIEEVLCNQKYFIMVAQRIT